MVSTVGEEREKGWSRKVRYVNVCSQVHLLHGTSLRVCPSEPGGMVVRLAWMNGWCGFKEVRELPLCWLCAFADSTATALGLGIKLPAAQTGAGTTRWSRCESEGAGDVT